MLQTDKLDIYRSTRFKNEMAFVFELKQITSFLWKARKDINSYLNKGNIYINVPYIVGVEINKDRAIPVILFKNMFGGVFKEVQLVNVGGTYINQESIYKIKKALNLDVEKEINELIDNSLSTEVIEKSLFKNFSGVTGKVLRLASSIVPFPIFHSIELPVAFTPVMGSISFYVFTYTIGPFSYVELKTFQGSYDGGMDFFKSKGRRFKTLFDVAEGHQRKTYVALNFSYSTVLNQKFLLTKNVSQWLRDTIAKEIRVIFK